LERDRSPKSEWYSAWKLLLRMDNKILGIILLPLALNICINLHNAILQCWPYISAGLYVKPILSLLASAFSAIYVTSTSMLLLTARPPVAREEAFLPNLLALAGAFSVYSFGLLAPAQTPLVNPWLPLILMVLGADLVLLSLFYLRRSFSVTPQAHAVRQGGPYALIRHPMYAGNILSVFGLGLLIGTAESLLLSFAIAGLQIARAKFEERVLFSAFPDYQEYRGKAGAFLPRLSLRRTRAKL
jgi:protein-S-isoprenylcysteine O-methyltransferase Ste14